MYGRLDQDLLGASGGNAGRISIVMLTTEKPLPNRDLSVFVSIGSSFEEARADYAGLITFSASLDAFSLGYASLDR